MEVIKMRKVHGRTKRHHSLRTHLCGAKVLRDRKRKKVQKMLAKQQKAGKKNEEEKSGQ